MYSDAGDGGITTSSVKIDFSNEDRPSTDDGTDLTAFYKDVEDIQALTREIAQLSIDLEVKHGEKMINANVTESAKLQSTIESMMDRISTIAQQVKTKLDAIQTATRKLGETPEKEANNAGVIKIRQNQHARLIKAFSDAMRDYQAKQAESEKKYQNTIGRQIKMKFSADGNPIDDAEAERLAQEAIQEGRAEQLFSQAGDVLQRAIETRNDIKRIEQSMHRLNALFQDLAILVHEQGELFDVILNNVERSTQYMEKGREELAKAKKYQKASRKKMCWILIGVAVILAFVMAIILGYKG
jgi:t-SNARE complex subunit (syntaxin)